MTRPRAAVIAIWIAVVAWLSPVLTVVGGLLIYSGGSESLIYILYFIWGCIAAGALGIVSALICLFHGTQLYPDPAARRPWLLPKLLSYPVGFFGLIGGIYWLSLVSRG